MGGEDESGFTEEGGEEVKDGFATIYIPAEEWIAFLRSHGDFDDDVHIVFGRPYDLSNGAIQVDCAFSETDVPPDDWGGEPRKRVDALISQWKEQKDA